MTRVCRALLFVLCGIFVHAQENELHFFGPRTDVLVVFTASREAQERETRAVQQLRLLVQDFEHQTPDVSVLVAITAHDHPPVPDFVPVDRLTGTKKLISLISSYKAPIVLILDETTGPPRLHTGAHRTVCPPWLLQAVYQHLTSHHVPIRYRDFDAILHRLGWLHEDPRHALYIKEHIPAVRMENSLYPPGALHTLPALLTQVYSEEWDTHYVSVSYGGTLYLIREQFFVILILGAVITLLLSLAIFSFLSDSRKRHYWNTILAMWWLPAILGVLSVCSVFVATQLTALFFLIRFGTHTSTGALPLLALIVKHSIAIALSCVCMANSKTIRDSMLHNGFIGGYLASTLCLLYAVLFSVIDFSLSAVFALEYALSLVFFSAQRKTTRRIMLAMMFLLFAPFLYAYLKNSAVTAPLSFHQSNVFFALGCVPFMLFMLTLFFEREKSHPRIPFIRRRNLLLSGALLTVLVINGVLWSVSLSSTRIPQEITACYRISERGLTLSLHSPLPIPRHIRARTHARLSTAEIQKAQDHLQISMDSRSYFGGRINVLEVRSQLRAQAIELRITSPHGTAAYEADRPFTRLEQGSVIRFISQARPPLPFTVTFSGDQNSTMQVQATVWTYDNPLQDAPPVMQDTTVRFIPMFELTRDVLFPSPSSQGVHATPEKNACIRDETVPNLQE